MKFSVIAAAVASASAHKRHHYHHSSLPHHPIYHLVKDWLSPSQQSESFHCDYDASQDMEQWTYMLNIKRSVYVNGVRGFYQDRIINDISDKCMSNDIMQKFDGLRTIHHKIVTGDFFSMSLEEHQNAISDVIEALWTTVEDCRMVVPLQDMINWCKNNTDKCVHKHDLIQRLYDNAVEIVATLYDMYTIATRNTMCENNTTTVANWGKFSYDAAQLYSRQLGFDQALDTKKEVSHESVKEQINHVIDAAAATWPEHPRCPFRGVWEAFKSVKTYIKDEIHDDIHALKHIAHRKIHHLMDKVHRIEKKIHDEFSSGVDSITNMIAPPVPQTHEMPEYITPVIETPTIPQFDMSVFDIPQLNFGYHQQNFWGQAPQAQFGMPGFFNF